MSKRSDKVEMERRVRTVQEYILMDYPYADIVAQCIQKWGVCDRQAKRYIQDAYDSFKATLEKNFEKRLGFHLQRRMKLLRQLDPEERRTATGVRAELLVLRDIAKLEGLYIEKHEFSGKDGAPIPLSVTHEVVFKDYSNDSKAGV